MDKPALHVFERTNWSMLRLFVVNKQVEEAKEEISTLREEVSLLQGEEINKGIPKIRKNIYKISKDFLKTRKVKSNKIMARKNLSITNKISSIKQ